MQAVVASLNHTLVESLKFLPFHKPSTFDLRILTGKSTLKLNSNACEMHKYGHFGSWYIKSTIC